MTWAQRQIEIDKIISTGINELNLQLTQAEQGRMDIAAHNRNYAASLKKIKHLHQNPNLNNATKTEQNAHSLRQTYEHGMTWAQRQIEIDKIISTGINELDLQLTAAEQNRMDIAAHNRNYANRLQIEKMNKLAHLAEAKNLLLAATDYNNIEATSYILSKLASVYGDHNVDFRFLIGNISKLKDLIPNLELNNLPIILNKCKMRLFDNDLNQAISKHQAALNLNRNRKVRLNEYGFEEGREDWMNEIERFIRSAVRTPHGLSVDLEYVTQRVDAALDLLSHNTPNNIDVDQMTGEEFEFHCCRILESHGWKAQHKGGTGDQGVDIVAEMNEVRVAIQCKRYQSAVGNSAIQEVIAGKGYEMCNAAVVVSNARFTGAAKSLARALKVALIAPSDLPNLMDIVNHLH